MLNIIERKITLQLLVFYSLFVIPLLLGGVEVYMFQHDSLQQNAQLVDLGLARVIALDIESAMRATTSHTSVLSKEVAANPSAHALLTTFANDSLSHSEISLYVVCDSAGKIVITYPVQRSNAEPNCNFGDSVQRALNSDRPYIAPVLKNPLTHAYVVPVAMRISTVSGHVTGVLVVNLALTDFRSRLLFVRQQVASSGELHSWVVDSTGKPVASTEAINQETRLSGTLPGLKAALAGRSGGVTSPAYNCNCLFSYVPVQGTGWAVVIQRPFDVTFATVNTFQNSLIIALVMLTLGASFFWFALHGWVIRPLSRLAQLVPMIKPDQSGKVGEDKLLRNEMKRADEIGQLISAFSTMEAEIHDLFRKSDAESQARLYTLDAIMCSLDDAVLLEDPQGQIVYANYSFCRSVGLAAKDVVFDSFNESHLSERLLNIIVDPEAYKEAIQRAETGSGPSVVEFQVKGHYNQVGQLVPVRRDIRARLFSVRDQADQLIGRGKIFHDVTHQNEAERVKKNLLAIVSHELRTPLTAIKGYATSMLETDIELDAALQEKFLRRIVVEGDRMADLVTNLLEMSQVEAKTLKLHPDLYRLEALLESVIYNDDREHICMDVPQKLPLLYVDGRRIEVVLRNLLENAHRYAGKDATIEISARYLETSTDAAAAGLYLSFADNGTGIPSHLAERIFDSFYQIDGGRERASSGVGLGLAICRGFIEAHGGRIWAENRSGEATTGAVFHIWLPPKLLRTPDAQANILELKNVL